MELNRDEIIKALENCLTLEYSVACKGCPLSYKDERRMDCLELLMKSALSLIKELTEERDGFENLIHTMSKIENRMSETIEELTEENERLKQDKKILELQIEAKERICESYMLQYGTVADKEVWLKKEREGTIQKYREQLHRAFAHSDSKNKFNKGVFLEAVDQIAKEMEEGV